MVSQLPSPWANRCCWPFIVPTCLSDLGKPRRIRGKNISNWSTRSAANTTCARRRSRWPRAGQARMLLARAAAYARHRDYLSVLFNRETMEPLIAGSPFVRALEELVQTAKLNPACAAELTPQQCVDLVINGEAAMAIGFLDRRTKTLPTSSIAVAELPGSDTAYHWGQARWEPRARLTKQAGLRCAAWADASERLFAAAITLRVPSFCCRGWRASMAVKNS